MAAFPVDEAYLVGGWCAAALWGVFSVLFIYTITSVVRGVKTRAASPNRITTGAVIVLYALATVHISLALRRLIVAFIIIGEPGGSSLYLYDMGTTVTRIKDLAYITNLLIGDSVVVWRCFVVWTEHRYVVGIPIILLLGTAVAGYGAIGQYFLEKPRPSAAISWGTAMFAGSLTTNIVVTLLTAGRIWWLYRRSKRLLSSSGDYYHQVILLVLESGAIIAGAKILEFSFFEVADGINGDNALYVIYECMPQLTGIVPTAIIAAVNARRDIMGSTNIRTTVNGTLEFRTRTQTTERNRSDTHQLSRSAFSSANGTATLAMDDETDETIPPESGGKIHDLEFNLQRASVN